MRRAVCEKILSNIFGILAIGVFLTVFCFSLCITGVQNNSTIYDEYIYFQKDSVLVNVAKLLLGIFVLWIMGKVYDIWLYKVNKNAILCIFCIMSLAMGVYWVADAKAYPQGDQSMVCQYANAFNLGDFHGFHKGQYFSVNSWQLGMISFLRIVFLTFGYDNWTAFQYISACMLPIIILAGTFILRHMTDNNGKVEWIYLLLGISCVPMYIYTLFVYGEIISTALVLVTVWLMLSCFRKFHWGKAIIMGLALGVAVQLRTNVWIVVIALMITVTVKLIGKWEKQVLVTGIVALLGAILIHIGHWAFYADKVDPEAASLPASLYIVMGMNDDYEHNGWYNNYNYHTFRVADYDVDVANAIAMEDLRMYIQHFRTYPDYFVDFYTRKMNAQWNVPMYQCLKMTNCLEGNLSPLVAAVYNGYGIGWIMDRGMKIYQMVLYASILIWLLASIRKQKGIEQYILLIAVFGGFLFSLIWEAKTRYVFPYLIMMLPYGAMGIHVILTRLRYNKKKFVNSDK